MRRVAFVGAVLLSSTTAMAQSNSVMIDDLTTTEVQAAIDNGKTTAVYFVGGTHQNGPAVVLGKHNLLARHLSQRVAEELGNALAYPPNPYAPAGDPIEKTGHMRFAGHRVQCGGHDEENQQQEDHVDQRQDRICFFFLLTGWQLHGSAFPRQ